MDDLCEALSDAMIRRILRDLPVGLIQTYERILMKISKYPLPKQQIALRAFKWTVCSRRPMKTEELQEAVAFESSDISWDKDKIPDEDLMIETCRGLLVRDEVDRTVRFAHHTVQQYLLSAPTIGTPGETRFLVSSLPEAEETVGQLCLTYLCFSDFETQIAHRPRDVKFESIGVLKAGGPAKIPTVLGIAKSLLDIPYRLLGGNPSTAPLKIEYSKYLMPNKAAQPQVASALTEKYRLLEYIVEYWVDHTKDLGPPYDSKLRRLAMHQTLSFEFRPWGSNQHFGSYGCVSCSSPSNAKDLPLMSLFHYAAHIGHWNLMESLVTEYCHHEHPCYETLLIACRQGHDLIVRKLVPKINYDVSDGRAINVAVAAGYPDILDYFLDLSEQSAEDGRSLSSYDLLSNASSLLYLAATNGHDQVVDAILSRCRLRYDMFDESFYINEKDEHTGRTAFFSAVKSGNEKLVRILLTRGANIHAYGTTAFHVAAEHGHQEIYHILLDFTDICPYQYMGNETNHSEVEVEYELGARETSNSLFSRDVQGDTPLHKAARNGHSAILESMLDFRPSSIGETSYLEKRTPTYGARGSGTAMRPGSTALHLAADAGHVECVKILLENGADIESKMHLLHETPLYLAAKQGHEEVVQYLLQKRASPYVRARDNTIALEVAVFRGHDGVVRALLEYDYRRLGFNSNNTEMALLIETAAERGYEAVLRALLEGINTFERAHLEEILRVAASRGFCRALDLLQPLRERL